MKIMFSKLSGFLRSQFTPKRKLVKQLILAVLSGILMFFTIASISHYYHYTVKPALASRFPFMGWRYVSADENGIPTIHYRGDLGPRENPTTVCQYAMEYWEEWVTLCRATPVAYDSRRRFLHCADWLLEHGVAVKDMLVWQYDFPFYIAEPPWISGMAQGHALQVLIRAYTLTREVKYKEAASKALSVFFADIAQGGVRIVEAEDDNAWWYAEYTSPVRQPKVLNGMLYALLGVQEYYGVTGDERARTIFDNGIRAVLLHLEDYDAGNWTWYDRDHELPARHYHKIHVNQLRRLFEITQEEKFWQTAEKWSGYPDPGFFRKRRYIFTDFVLVIGAFGFFFVSLHFILFVTKRCLPDWIRNRSV
jgi:heparosan-N-sulfate-glucuronate 5-epimerase